MEFPSVKKVLGLKETIRTPLDLIKAGGKRVFKEAVSRLAKSKFL